jgi:His-Xaa-Ser system protein HxsD
MPAVEVVLDATSHSADAIQRAAYRFADQFSLELVRDGENYRCQLHFHDIVDETAVDGFRGEVIDQVLRERIRTETEGVRNVVLALAFSDAGLAAEPVKP